MHVIDAEAMKSKCKLQAVETHELQSWTEQGWRLVMITTKQELDRRQQYAGDGRYVDVATAYDVPLFIVMYDPDLVAQDLREQLKAANKSFSEIYEERNRFKKQLDLDAEELKNLVLRFDLMKAERNDHHKRNGELAHAMAKMEYDLAAVRGAIGTERMKQILEAAAMEYAKKVGIKT
jgi:hypothetical protein